MAAGILARAAIGLVLFWVSYLQLPTATLPHSGDGFWQLAPDAQNYYELATRGVSATLRQFESNPSPVFVSTLALWMSVVGISPASALLLNLSLFVMLMVALVRYYQPVDNWRRDLPFVLGIAAYSFSPVLLLHSTQPLKDALTCTLIGFACVGVLGIRGLIYRESESTTRGLAPGIGVLLISTFAIAGVRWYYAVIVFGAVAMMLAVFGVGSRTIPWWHYARRCAVVLAALSMAVMAGVGSDHRQLVLGAAIAGPRQVAMLIEYSRSGFVSSGGATNIGSAVTIYSGEGSGGPGLDMKSGMSTRVVRQVKALSIGAAFMFLPISLVTANSGIALEGGRGLIPVADLDTIFQDVVIVCIGTLLWKRRRDLGSGLPFVVFALVLSVASAVLMAYVVTNVGTMVRLRLLVTVPLWFLGMALSTRPRTAVPSRADRGAV